MYDTAVNAIPDGQFNFSRRNLSFQLSNSKTPHFVLCGVQALYNIEIRLKSKVNCEATYARLICKLITFSYTFNSLQFKYLYYFRTLFWRNGAPSWRGGLTKPALAMVVHVSSTARPEEQSEVNATRSCLNEWFH